MDVIEIYYYIPNQESSSLKIMIDKPHQHIVPIDGFVGIGHNSDRIYFKTSSLYISSNIFMQLPNFKLLHFDHCQCRQEMCVCASINFRQNNQAICCYIDYPHNAEKVLKYIGCKKFFSWYPKSTS